MQIINLKQNDDGSHENQTLHGALPEGWAIIPPGMVCENFPFGDVSAEEIDGVLTVISWTPLPMPELEEAETDAPDESTESVWNELDAAYREGVDSV